MDMQGNKMELLFKSRTNIPPIKEIDTFDSWDDSKFSPDRAKDLNCDMCPHCLNSDCLDMTDLVTCKECGYIISRPFDNTAEYRYFSYDDRGGDPTRVGAPQDPRLPEASLGTVILNGYGTAKTMYRVRKYHTWNTVPYKERSFIQTCERLSLIGLNNGINQSVIEEAKNLFTTLQEIGGRQGLSRDALLSACIYISLKKTGSPRKHQEIATIFGINPATFTKAYKQTNEIIAVAQQKGLLNTLNTNKPSQSSTKATEYIQLPLSRLQIPREQINHLHMLCTRIAQKSEEAGLSQENMPPSLAAGCIAFVIKRCQNLNVSITKIAEVSEISLATLQKCLRRLESHSDILETVI
jgi:transcription initiation factor TFIIIB Brf1 subunit/transcription initiation factor TFIIB